MNAQLLTIPQAADRLAVSPRQVRRLIADHGLPTVSIGKDRRVPEAGLIAWIVERTTRGERE